MGVEFCSAHRCCLQDLRELIIHPIALAHTPANTPASPSTGCTTSCTETCVESNVQGESTTCYHRRVRRCATWRAGCLTLCRGTSGSFGVPADRDDKHPPPSIETLDAYALERWEVQTRLRRAGGTLLTAHIRRSYTTWCRREPVAIRPGLLKASSFCCSAVA